MNFLSSPFNLGIRPTLGVGGEEILDDGAGEWEYSLPRGRSRGQQRVTNPWVGG